ncbi:MAG: 2-C-methyl-D-erythritol 4-phosphate cytidylyltransferase, partial [Chloroflexi bacterium]|nr:2-C-methyl-D-erythritol 4-phosphate cytidylyltransferase [Chloroflexota bacterium]
MDDIAALAKRLAGKVSAILVSAGESRRMGAIDKTFALLLGQPLIAHTVQAFEACPLVDEIVLVLAKDKLEQGHRLTKERGWRKVRKVCAGGARRQDSVLQGLAQVSSPRWVIIHDGARPCVTPGLVLRGLDAALETGAAVAAIPVQDTIKVVRHDQVVVETPPRDQLHAVQTPQVFLRELLEEAYRGEVPFVTDDATLLERRGHLVRVFCGAPWNLKVTVPEDLILA